ncbi:MAG: hypothetical protein R3F59_33685 [Myxococcota bacterium]
MQTVKNLTAGWLATRGTRNSGLVGTLAKLGIARRLTRGRGLSAKLARAGITARTLKLGLGAGLGAAAVAAGAYGANRLIQQRRHRQDELPTELA